MLLVKSDNLNQIIKNKFTYTFNVSSDGLYLLEVVASARSWWQNFKTARSFFADDDLTLTIDNAISFPKLNHKKGLFDGEVAWNGNNLKGLFKTNLILINLKPGSHTLDFLADQSPALKSISIFQIEDSQKITYIPEFNNESQNDDPRQLLTVILANQPLDTLSVKASAQRQPNKRSDNDLKLIIDGRIEKNHSSLSHRDWYWCGKILNGQEKEYSQQLSMKTGLHYVELWVKGEILLLKVELCLGIPGEKIEKGIVVTEIKKYGFGGISDKENYNRYDEIIKSVVDYWNKEFLNDVDPPSELLDPSLVKAIIFQESRIGYDLAGKTNVMQIGNLGDPSLLTLRGELEEFWLHSGKIELLKYDAAVNSVEDSVRWGVRWLYHKAQYITVDNRRGWFSWKEAVKRYGPATNEYLNSVWDIYVKGIKKEGDHTYKLWTLILVLVSFLFFNTGRMYTIESKIFDSLTREKQFSIEDIQNDIKVNFYKNNRELFFTIIERERDWWEELKVGRSLNDKIEWLNIEEPPTEPYILSSKFLDLEGFGWPILEIYGKTHVGYGSLYIYKIEDKKAKLLLKIPAVDSKNDQIWSPNNYKRYGLNTCGEVFKNGKLLATYQDLNKDGVADVVLNGELETFCDKEDRESYDERAKTGNMGYTEIKVGDISVKKVYLWDKKATKFK